MLKLLGNVKHKTVYEYGSGVGTLTKDLAVSVGPSGRIFGTDLSKTSLHIAQKRMDKLGHKHVKLLHDPKHTQRAHPKVPRADALVSEGMLGYIKDPEKVLRHLGTKLKKGAKVAFVDYDKLFWSIPNIEWLNNDENVKKVFNKAGFSVKIHRDQGIAWKYVFIVGKKK